MSYTLQPIDYFNVNDFVPKSAWDLQNSAPVSLYFVLQKTDRLGTRRFLPPAGSSVTVIFLRSRPASINSVAANLTKVASAVTADDKSLFRVDLTADDSSKVISGSLQLVVTIGGTPYTQSIPYAIKKVMSGPGF
jgi:hypothetical protein